MSDVLTWSTTAINNNAASPDGFPEGMAPSGVNDSAREVMAAVRRWVDSLSISEYSDSLVDAVTAIGSDLKMLLIDKVVTLDENLVIPANIQLCFNREGSITITDCTLDFEINPDAGPYQIFDCVGTGAVTGLTSALPEWFGAAGDGVSDDLLPLQQAMDSANITFLLDGKVYLYTEELYPPANHTIMSHSPGAVLYRSTTTGGSHAGGLLPYNYVTLRNFTLRGSGAAYVAGADGIIVLYNNAGTWESPGVVVDRDQTDMAKWRGAHLNIENVTFENWAANGVEAGPYSIIKNVIVQNCLNEGMLIQGDRVQITNPMVLNCAGWGIDLNCSFTTVLGGLIQGCGDTAAFPLDMGGIIIASHTQITGAVGNKVIGTTIDTSDGPGILVYAPTDIDYDLTDTVIQGVTIKNVCVDTADTNLCAIDVSDMSTSGTKLDRVTISGVIIDTTTVGHGIGVLGARNVNIDDYHIKSAAAKGIYLYSGTGAWEGITIGKGTIKGCGTDGIYAYNGSKLNIAGYNISDSLAVAAYDGIRLEDVTKFNIGQGIIDLDVTNGYGIYLTRTTGLGIVSGANIINCLQEIYNDSTGNCIQIYGNLGYPTAPAVPASTTPEDNPNPFPVRVTVVGATVSAIAIGPTGATVATGATSGSVILQPSWDIVLTYSAFADTTGDTDGSTAVITGLTDTTGFSIGSVVTASAGFPAVTLTVVSKTATTLTLDVASDSSQTDITVTQAKPTWAWTGM